MASVSEEIALLRGTPPATFRNLLRVPGFLRLGWAILVSSLGDWVGFVAVVSLVTTIGGGRAEFAVAGVMLARLLPSIIFGPFAGVLVDRFDRKKLMIIADVIRGLGYASMPLLPSLAAIYAVSFFIECLSLLWTPARDAMIPNIVPRRQLTNANTVALATGYGTLPFGGLLFTALAAVSGVIGGPDGYLAENREALALWMNSLTFAFSAVMISGLPARGSVRTKGGRLRPGQALEDLKEGIRFLKDHTFARAMTIGIVLAFTGAGSVMSLGPVFAQSPDALDAGAAGWGFLVSAVGFGLFGGMLVIGQLSKLIEKDRLFTSTILVGAAALAVLAFMPNIGLAALATVFLGIAAGATWVNGYTLLQENTSDDLRGRVFGSLTVLSRLGLFVSLAGFPALAGAVGTHTLHLGGQELVVSGTRLAILAGAGVLTVGGLLSRRGLASSRMTRPRPLKLFPRLRKTERRGTFIVFEGVEGAGKGTQIRMAREFLEAEGHEVLVTREPGGTGLGERLRDALLVSDGEPIDARAEALLFAASRAQHVTKVIRPALEEGKLVLCDRYLDSSMAYQGAARGLGEHDVLSLNVWATQGLFPDLVVLLHLEPETGMARNESEPDRIEREDESFHARVADAFLRIAEDHPERFVVVPAGDGPEAVHARVKEALTDYLRREEKDEE